METMHQASGGWMGSEGGDAQFMKKGLNSSAVCTLTHRHMLT